MQSYEPEETQVIMIEYSSLDITGTPSKGKTAAGLSLRS